MESGDLYAFFDERLLKKKAKELVPCLNSCCIFLIGMMGCGKTTVGKVSSEALGYAFVDSGTYVEQAVGEISVAQIFQQHGESVFRDNEVCLHVNNVLIISSALYFLLPGLVTTQGGGL
ncbi:shikimate kinase 3, chloroplastic-like [Populus nigra]|uniref:shikimate kinase 3, chloroplastic-like n=1 Tax=Populus nigra TaxID=3691 RepID=UPI002B271587|nr:shikimate kinase 3, chloroplastic-like [Populus nigra]